MSAPTLLRVPGRAVPPRHRPPDRVRAVTVTLPHVRDVTHHCGLAPDWGPPHTVAVCFTRAETDGDRVALHGVLCDGSPITLHIDLCTGAVL